MLRYALPRLAHSFVEPVQEPEVMIGRSAQGCLCHADDTRRAESGRVPLRQFPVVRFARLKHRIEANRAGEISPAGGFADGCDPLGVIFISMVFSRGGCVESAHAAAEAPPCDEAVKSGQYVSVCNQVTFTRANDGVLLFADIF